MHTVKSETGTGPGRAARLWTGGLLAACVVWAGMAGAADLKTELEAAANGDTISVGAGTDYDLNGTSIRVTANNVTLQGTATHDLGAAVRTGAAGLKAATAGAAEGLSEASVNAAARAIVDDIEAKRSTSNIHNSAAATGTFAGISAPHGGFSVKDITLSGTTAVMDSSTGASKYMGLIGSTFDRSDSTVDPTDGQGMGMIENVTFSHNTVESTGAIHNMGNVLFFSQRRYDATGQYTNNEQRIEVLDGIKGSSFIGNRMLSDMTASVGMRDVGAAGAGWVDLTTLESSLFADNYTRGHHAFGGALFVYTIGNVSDNVFYNNIVDSDHDAYGGALMSSGGIGNITNSVFIGNQARGLDFGLGRVSGVAGGAIRSSGADTFNATGRVGIGSITGSTFAYNKAINETGEEAYGGAIDVGRHLGTVENSMFYGNAAKSNGDAFGGAISYAVSFGTGDAASKATTIRNSQFYNNSADGDGLAGGGALSFAVTAAGVTDFTLNLEATSGKATVFSGNSVNGKANSIYVGDRGAGTTNTDVVFNVNAAAGGKVHLLDPIRIDMNNGKTFTLNNASSGDFRWGGANVLNAAGGSFVNFAAGKNVTLTKDFSISSDNGSAINVDFGSGANVTMLLSGRDKNQALFDGVTNFTNVAGTKLTGEYYGFMDKTETFVVAEGGAAGSLNTADFTTAASKNSTLTLSQSGGKLLATMAYKADTSGFNNASSNAQASRPGLQEVWDKVVAPNYTAAQQQELHSLVSINPENFMPSAHLNFAQVAFSANLSTTTQALAANRRSRAGTAGMADAGQLSSGSALASATYDYDCVGGRFRVWADYIGSRIDQDGKKGYSGYDADTNGAVFGASYDVSSALTLGGYMSYADGSADFDTVSADFDSDIYQGGLFAQYRSECSGWLASFDMSYTHLDNDSTRFAAGRNEASFDQGVFSAGLEVGYEFNPWCNGRLTPFAGLRYQRLHQDGINERGGAFALNMESFNSDSFASSIGVNLAHDFVGESTVVTPSLYAAWRHEYADTGVSSTYRFAGMNTVTSADSLDRKRDAFEIGAAVSAILVQRADFSFGLNGGYNASISSDRVEHNFHAGVEFRF